MSGQHGLTFDQCELLLLPPDRLRSWRAYGPLGCRHCRCSFAHHRWSPRAPGARRGARNSARADKDEDGRVTLAELVEPRRKAFAKLDVNADGRLSFEEWAVRTIDKFEGADADDNAALTPAEYATTAPKPRSKKPACACG